MGVANFGYPSRVITIAMHCLLTDNKRVFAYTTTQITQIAVAKKVTGNCHWTESRWHWEQYYAVHSQWVNISQLESDCSIQCSNIHCNSIFLTLLYLGLSIFMGTKQFPTLGSNYNISPVHPNNKDNIKWEVFCKNCWDTFILL